MLSQFSVKSSLLHRHVIKGEHRGTVPPQTVLVPPATGSQNYEKIALYIVHPDGRDALMPVF